MTPNEFIDAARTMLGVKFMHQGRSEKFGVDCAGLAVVAGQMCGVEVFDYTDYKRRPDSSDFLVAIRKNCDRVPTGEEKPGDLWVFKFDNSPMHVAIQTALNPPKMIHSYVLVGRVVEHGIDESWKARKVAVYRPKALQNQAENKEQ